MYLICATIKKDHPATLDNPTIWQRHQDKIMAAGGVGGVVISIPLIKKLRYTSSSDNTSNNKSESKIITQFKNLNNVSDKLYNTPTTINEENINSFIKECDMGDLTEPEPLILDDIFDDQILNKNIEEILRYLLNILQKIEASPTKRSRDKRSLEDKYFIQIIEIMTKHKDKHYTIYIIDDKKYFLWQLYDLIFTNIFVSESQINILLEQTGPNILTRGTNFTSLFINWFSLFNRQQNLTLIKCFEPYITRASNKQHKKIESVNPHSFDISNQYLNFINISDGNYYADIVPRGQPILLPIEVDIYIMMFFRTEKSFTIGAIHRDLTLCVKIFLWDLLTSQGKSNEEIYTIINSFDILVEKEKQ